MLQYWHPAKGTKWAVLNLYKWDTKEELVEWDRRCDRRRKGWGHRGEK